MTDDAKRFATLQAAAGMRGIAVYRLTPEDGAEGYRVQWYGMHRDVPDLAALRALLDRMGVSTP